MTEPSPHQEMIDLFSDYYDEELDPVQVANLEAHFDACETCREEYRSFKGSLSLFGGLKEAHVPDDFLKEVTTSINRQSRGTFFKESWIFGLRVPYEAFIALLLVVFGAIYFFGVSNRSTYVVADDEASEMQPGDAPMGRALGAQSHQVQVQVPRSIDLQKVAAALRQAGFATSFDVVESEVAVVANVQSKDLPAFQKALAAAAGDDVQRFDEPTLARHPNLSVRILNGD
ncbi:MAG: hypothetical protein CO108_23820 [Deltaproteobacteria bacterium CG_4_9_14_3_um_filter_63_12]|nr:MAG: hypothetical protein COW42_00955 [Deltaproteobacteria bacterium CG17_big_fil_post_rev_8_21_14_2_50_63_7]PJB36252.1 MAG: hypothetical protein CO108_23820 [Deltaproteobacteria bacterium CG_4_9_14_3_um_filter_63_12]